MEEGGRKLGKEIPIRTRDVKNELYSILMLLFRGIINEGGRRSGEMGNL